MTFLRTNTHRAHHVDFCCRPSDVIDACTDQVVRRIVAFYERQQQDTDSSPQTHSSVHNHAAMTHMPRDLTAVPRDDQAFDLVSRVSASGPSSHTFDHQRPRTFSGSNSKQSVVGGMLDCLILPWQQMHSQVAFSLDSPNKAQYLGPTSLC